MDNPIVRRFQNYIDGQKIDDWYEARGHVRKGKEPRFGFIASVDGVDAAAGFISASEDAIWYVHSWITNPACSSEARHVSQDAVWDAIVELAENERVEKIVGYTKDEGVIKRIGSWGAELHDAKVMLYRVGGNRVF